jgi:hypothetical protein
VEMTGILVGDALVFAGAWGGAAMDKL